MEAAENRISETEERVQVVEEAVLEVLKLQEKLEARFMDQEGRLRQGNIRLHGTAEGAEDNSPTMVTFVENLLREKLEIPASTELRIERAHRSLGPKQKKQKLKDIKNQINELLSLKIQKKLLFLKQRN